MTALPSQRAASTDVPSAHLPRRPWISPSIAQLPKLTDLTLFTPIGGGGGIGGSTVFGILLAAGLLFGIGACSDQDLSRPSRPATPSALSQPLTCRVDVPAASVTCNRPEGSAGPVTIGGQGTRVALRSTNVHYSSDSALFSASVTVQNLLAQTLGGPGGGVNVFFESGPDVTGGTGAVTVANPSGTATFDAANQPYFLYPDSIPSGQTSPPLIWQWNVPGTVTSFVFTVLISTEVDEDQGVLFWSEMPNFKSDSFVDLAVNSSTDAMVVGADGRVLRKVGSRWSELAAQSPYNWVGVSAIGGGQYVGATTAGTVLLFDGKVWNTVRNAGFNIEGITAYAANRIAIGGDSGGSPRLSWLGNSGWFSIGLGGGSTFGFLASYNVDQGVGATLDGSVYAFNFNSPTPTPKGSSAPITAFFGAVSKADFGRALLSGGTAEIFDEASGAVYTGGADTVVDAIDYGSVNPVFWAAVRNVTTDSSRLMSYSGGVWTDRALLPQPVVRMMQDSTGGLYLLSADGIRRWNGSAVVDELVAPAADYPTAMAALGSRVAVGTVDGNVRRLVSGSWVTDDPDGSAADSIVSIQLAGNDTILVAAGQSLRRYDGTSWSSFGGPIGIDVAAMWAPTSDQAVVLLQGSDFVYRMNGPGDFSQGTVNPGGGLADQLRAIWGIGLNDFWMVGDNGRVVWYDGTSYVNKDPGTGNALRAVTGTSSSDVWVGGTNGYVAHWDGSGWTDCSLGTSETVTSLWTSGSGVVYAGTQFASDTLYNITCGVRSLRIPSAAGAVRVVSGSSTNQLWALVGNGLFEGRR